MNNEKNISMCWNNDLKVEGLQEEFRGRMNKGKRKVKEIAGYRARVPGVTFFPHPNPLHFPFPNPHPSREREQHPF
jgi:hypothetical protein